MIELNEADPRLDQALVAARDLLGESALAVVLTVVRLEDRPGLTALVTGCCLPPSVSPEIRMLTLRTLIDAYPEHIRQWVAHFAAEVCEVPGPEVPRA